MGRRAINGSGGVRNQQRRNAKQAEARAPHVDKYAAKEDPEQAGMEPVSGNGDEEIEDEGFSEDEEL